MIDLSTMEVVNRPGILVTLPDFTEWHCSRRRPPWIIYDLDTPETVFYFTGSRIGERPSDCTRVFDWGDFFDLSIEEERARYGEGEI